MAVRSTDFYLNLDRWAALSTVERQRGRWEVRLEGPAARLDPIRREALLEAAWALHSPGDTLDRNVRPLLIGSTRPENAPTHILRAWSYYRALQFVHGWYPAFGWSAREVGQLCRILAEPEGDETERSISVLLFVKEQAARVERDAGGTFLLELAAFYGGLRYVFAEDPAHPHLYLLGFRLLLLQKGYVQVLFAPIEPAWIDAGKGVTRHPAPPWDDRATDLEARLGGWLDELVQLLVTSGERAEELWEQAAKASSRSALQEAILSLAQRNGRVTAGDVLRETGANRNTVKDNLARLVQAGSLQRQGTKRGTVYLPV